MSTNRKKKSNLDWGLVDQITEETMLNHGYGTVDDGDDESGAETPDDDKLKSAVVKAMHRHVVSANTVKELSANSVTKVELFAEVFPQGIAVGSDESVSKEVEQARQDLMTKVWGFTNTGTTGHVQKAVGGSGLILCDAGVSRVESKVDGGPGVGVTVRGRFLTNDPATILNHYTNPAGQSFVGAATKLQRQLEIVVERHPELDFRIANQIAGSIKTAVAAIPSGNPSLVKASKAASADEAESA
jgi:hypothetical protein